MPDPMALAPKLDKPIPYPALSWQEAQRIGRENMASQATLKGFNVVREDMLQYAPDYGVFFYIVHTNRDLIEEVGSTWLVWMAQRGNTWDLIYRQGKMRVAP